MNALKKFFILDKKEKKTLVEALFFCVFIKLMVLLFPIKKYYRILGEPNNVYGMEPSTREQQVITHVSRAIVRCRKIIPWNSKCLTEAITAKIMLKRRRILSTLYLGVKKNDGTLIAHAWLRCGSIFVTGRRESGNFTIVSTFA